MEDNKAIIEGIIKGAFERVSGATDNEKSHLIFPHYRSGAVRVSEQELRFAFVEELRTVAPQWYYAVEVPTDSRYYFKNRQLQVVRDGGVACYVENGQKTNDPIVDKNGKKSAGQSGNFDLVVYEDKEGKKPIALIEFKGKNPTNDETSFKKDYLKLKNGKEGNGKSTLRYFLQIVDLSEREEEIREQIRGKIMKANDVEGSERVEYRCCDVKKGDVTDKILKKIAILRGLAQPLPQNDTPRTELWLLKTKTSRVWKNRSSSICTSARITPSCPTANSKSPT